MIHHRILLTLLAAAMLPSSALAQSPPPPRSLVPAAPERPVEVELRSAARAVAPGDTVPVAIRLLPNRGWHTYWRHAGDVGSAPSVAWRLPEGFTAAPLRWPTPELIASPPLASYGYEREVHLLGAVHVPRTARVGSTATLAATLTWVVCNVECVADEVDLALTLPVAAAPVADTAAARAFAAEDARVPARLADWEFRSAVDTDAVVLRVRPPGGAGLLAGGDAARVRFFVDAAGVIDHAAPAAARVDGDELELRLARSQYASGTPARLTGVLALAGRGGGDEGFAIEVDAPVVAMAQLAPAGGPAGAGGGWLALATAGLLALLGGTLLNLMPCVLPVL
ncbi:MAG TPA: protein-disulfide reductase DsbD domain-containing protein, partial [Longimicrobium sp.]|nr:protein-disulfide reductase DsbD domain-containing protein [Longimicrobium sp.]